MNSPISKRNYWTYSAISIVDISVIQVARVVRTAHTKHVRVVSATTIPVEVKRTHNNFLPILSISIILQKNTKLLRTFFHNTYSYHLML